MIQDVLFIIFIYYLIKAIKTVLFYKKIKM